MSTIGYTTLEVIPSLKGVEGAIASSLGGMDAAGRDAGTKLGQGMSGGLGSQLGNLTKFGAVAAGGIGLAVGALYSVGSTFDDVSDKIRTGTGATGDQLNGLVDVAKNVGREVPASFDKIGDVVAQLSSKMKLSGDDLQAVSEQVLELQNMGQDVNLDAVAGAMNAFGVASGDTAATLDQLFQVSQATGVPVSELAASAEKGAPALKEFGFNAAASAGLIGSLDKAGLDSDKMLGGLNKSLVNFAKEGKNPQQALYGTVEQIDNFTKAGNDAAAIDMAGKLFGTKGAAQFVDAVKSGQFSVDDFVSATGAGTDTIKGAADDTKDFAEQWELFKNQALLAIEPIAERVFGMIGDAMTFITETGVPALKDMANWMSENKTALEFAAIPLGALVAGMIAFNIQQGIAAEGSFLKYLGSLMSGTKLAAAAQFLFNGAMWAWPGTWIIAGIVALVAVIVLIATKTDWFSQAWNAVWGGIKDATAAVVGWFTNTVGPAFAAVWDAITGAFSKAVDFIKDHWKLILSIILGPVTAIVYQVVTHWDQIKAATGALIDAVVGIWNGFIGFLRNAWNGLVAVWNNIWDAIVGAWNAVWGALKWGLDGFVSFFTVVIPNALNWWLGVWRGVWDAIVGAWNAVWGVLKAGFDSFVAFYTVVIPNAVVAAKDWIINIWNEVVGFVTGLPGRIANAAAGMWDGLKDAFKGAINWIISAWNDFHISMKIPSDIPIVGGKGFTIDTPDLPLLIAGGTVPGTSSPIGFPSGDDQIIGAKTGEYVMPVAQTRANFGLLEAMRSGTLRGYAAGGVVSADELDNFARGVEGAPYVWGGVHWGDCSGAVAAIANFAVGRDPFGSRFATGSEADELAARGFQSGLGPAGSLSVGWFNGGPYGGHTAATLPSGVNFEMGGNRGNGQYGGAAAGADNSQFTDHAYLPFARKPNPYEANPLGGQNPDQTPGFTAGSATTSTTTTTTGSAAVETKNYPTTISGFAGLFGKAFAEGQTKSLLSVFGLPDSAPGLDAYNELKKQQDESAAKASSTTDAKFGAVPSEAQNAPIPTTPPAPARPEGADGYAFDIAKAAKDKGLSKAAAVIAEATALVESGDPLKMWANSKVPESLNFPHDAVGSDGTSTGLFQQQDNGAWGTLADRMDPVRSAGLFYDALLQVSGWESMSPGAAAQAVQRSAFPDRYEGQIGRGTELVDKYFDEGGVATGRGVLLKDVLSPERMLSPRQNTAFEQMVDRDFQPTRGATANGEQVTYNIYADRVQDAFVAAQNQQKRRALAKVGSF